MLIVIVNIEQFCASDTEQKKIVFRPYVKQRACGSLGSRKSEVSVLDMCDLQKEEA